MSESGAGARLLDQILTDGVGTVRLDPSQATALNELYREAKQFFAKDVADKIRHSTPKHNVGYRTHGHAYAMTPERPDLNDSFLHWRQAERIPNHEAIGSFVTALEAYRQVTAGLVGELIADLRQYYNYEHSLRFEDSSFIQVNSYREPTERDLLQDPHEDRILLTVISTNAEGLELVLGGNDTPSVMKSDQVVIMPGSIMTDMTGGEIPPLYHQVRNHGNVERMSIMYFVSPDASTPITPFVVNDHNRGIDIRDRVINNPQAFGLAEDFILTPDSQG